MKVYSCPTEVPDSMLRELTDALLRGQNSNQFLDLIERAEVSAWIGTPSGTLIGWRNLIEEMPMIFIPVDTVEMIAKNPLNYEVELETDTMNFSVSTKRIAENF